MFQIEHQQKAHLSETCRFSSSLPKLCQFISGILLLLEKVLTKHGETMFAGKKNLLCFNLFHANV